MNNTKHAQELHAHMGSIAKQAHESGHQDLAHGKPGFGQQGGQEGTTTGSHPGELQKHVAAIAKHVRKSGHQNPATK